MLTLFRLDRRLLAGVSVLAVTQCGASLMGLIRDRVLASTFPGLSVVDVYIASFRPSDLLFQVTIAAGFSVCLVPFLGSLIAHNQQKKMNDLLSSVMSLAAVLFGGAALLLSVCIPYIAPYLVQFKGESLALYISFARLSLLTNFLFVFGNAFGHFLIARERYWIYGLTPILYTLGTVYGTVFLTPFFGPYGPMMGTVLGGALFVLVRLLGALSLGWRGKVTLWHPDIPSMGALMLPRVCALGALQVELLLFDTIASGLGAGAVTVNAYARNFQSVIVGIAGIALAQSAYSRLSQSASLKDRKQFFSVVKKGTLILIVLTIPGAITLSLLSPIAAALVSLSHVLPLFSLVLTLYALSIPFESINHLFLRAFYATKHTLTPALLSVLNGIVAILTAFLLLDRFGIGALALGFSVGQVLQTIGLALFLPRRLRPHS